MQDPTDTLAPPCPAWCTETNEAHRRSYDSVAVDSAREMHRYHSRDFGSAAVVQDEVSVDGRVSYAPPTISTYDDDARTPSEARKLAADVLNAADFADEIAGGGDAR